MSKGVELTPRQIQACLLLVRAKLTTSMPDAQHKLWLGLEESLRGDLRSRPPPMGQKIINLFAASLARDALAIGRAIDKLCAALREHGETQAAVDLKKAIELAKSNPQMLGSLVKDGGGANDGADKYTDTRVLEWVETPKMLSEDFIPDKLCGPQLVKLVAHLRKTNDYLAKKIDPKTRVLFVGPPGVGKTMAAAWVAAELGMMLAVGRLDGIASPLIGQTAKNLRALFDALGEEERPSVLFLDEIDGIASRRDADGAGTHESSKQNTNAFLQQINLLAPTQIVIGATNLEQALDPALRRRLPTRVKFQNPDKGTREEMLRRWWSKLKVEDEARELVVDLTEDKSGDYLRSIAMESARSALDEGEVIRVAHIENAFMLAPEPGKLREVHEDAG